MKGNLIQMKKLALLFITALLLIVLAACGGEAEPVQESQPSTQDTENAPVPVSDSNPAESASTNDDSASADDEAADGESQEPDVFFFKIGDAVVNLNENITYVIERAGQPLGELRLPSCAFDGDDIVFSYPGANLYTYPVGDDDFVYNIALIDSTIRTAEGGIRLGSSLQDVLDAYGDDFELESGMYTFTRGLTVLEFLVVDDEVRAITYRYLVEI